MVGVVGKAIKGFGKALKHGSKQRKGIRKLPFGKFVDFPIEVATKHKKAAGVGAGAAAAGVAYGRHKEKSKTDVPEEIKALVTGTRKVSKNQKKFKK